MTPHARCEALRDCTHYVAPNSTVIEGGPATFLVDGEPPVLIYTLEAFFSVQKLYQSWVDQGFIQSFRIKHGNLSIINGKVAV